MIDSGDEPASGASGPNSTNDTSSDKAASELGGAFRARVLHVEDSQANRELVREIIGLIPGVDVASAGNAQEALRWASNNRADLVMLDMRLPDADGIDLLRQLRALPNYRDTPCIGISGDGSSSKADAAYAAGFVDYLVKPVEVDAMLNSISKSLKLT